MTSHRRWILLWGSSLTGLALFSLWLAFGRIIQVDEAQNVMMARILGAGWAQDHATGAPLMLLGPLSWIAGRAQHSEPLFLAFRGVFVGVFWANLGLMVKAAGIRLRSGEGLVALLGVATLAPLWDYGFEIRHDNLLLTGVLGMWVLLLPKEGELPYTRYVGAGILVSVLQLLAFKAFVYTLPVLAVALAWRWVGGRPLKHPLVALLGGLAAGLALGMILHWMAGTWTIYFKDAQVLAKASLSTLRFAPWDNLTRLFWQAPLLLGGWVLLWVLPFRQSPEVSLRAWILERPWLRAVALSLAALAAFLANPTPFAYNLVLLVPFVAISVLTIWRSLLGGAPSWGRVAMLGVAHLFPWWHATSRHLDMTNARQLELMSFSETLTDPIRHHVMDGSGLVPTRRPPGYRWLIHSFTIQSFLNGTHEPFRSQLARVETPVLLLSYRTSWISQEDADFINAHYRPMAEDVAVLGFSPRVGLVEWEALAEGRYWLGGLNPRGGVKVDGQPASQGEIRLSRGPHRFEAKPGVPVWLSWMGPILKNEPRISPAPGPLFVNWY